MTKIEENIKEIINTGLGAFSELESSINENKGKVQMKIEETQTQVKKYFDDLKTKGAADNSEIAVKVRGQVSELFVTIDTTIKNVDDFTNENLAKLKLQLAKYDITLPEYEELSQKVNAAIADGQSKVEGFVASFKKEKVSADT